MQIVQLFGDKLFARRLLLFMKMQKTTFKPFYLPPPLGKQKQFYYLKIKGILYDDDYAEMINDNMAITFHGK